MLAFVALGSAALTVFLASGPSSKKRMLFSVILCACIGTPLVYLTIEQTKTWRDTEALWTQALLLDCRRSKAIMHHNLAALYTDRGEIERAMPHHQSAVQIDPSYAQGWEGIAQAHQHNGDLPSAELEYQRALEADPKNPRYRLEFARFLRSQARLVEASKLLKEASELDPTNSEVSRERREVESELRIFTANPDSLEPKERARALLARGVQFERQNQVEEAAKAYREATELDPADFNGWNNLGLALIKQKRTAQAERCFAKAVELLPNYSVAHLNWGNSLIELGRDREGAAQLQEALRLDPNNVQARKGLDYVAKLHVGRAKD